MGKFKEQHYTVLCQKTLAINAQNVFLCNYASPQNSINCSIVHTYSRSCKLLDLCRISIVPHHNTLKFTFPGGL